MQAAGLTNPGTPFDVLAHASACKMHGRLEKLGTETGNSYASRDLDIAEAVSSYGCASCMQVCGRQEGGEEVWVQQTGYR